MRSCEAARSQQDIVRAFLLSGSRSCNLPWWRDTGCNRAVIMQTGTRFLVQVVKRGRLLTLLAHSSNSAGFAGFAGFLCLRCRHRYFWTSNGHRAIRLASLLLLHIRARTCHELRIARNKIPPGGKKSGIPSCSPACLLTRPTA